MSKAIKVGQAYTCKVGRNSVEVKVLSTCDGGWVVGTATGRQLTVKNAARLNALPAAERAPGAHVAAPAQETPKRTKAVRGSHVGQQGATQAKEKRTSLMDAAAKVVAEADPADLPMGCKKMVETAMAKGYWAPLKGGKTPVNTLAAMILRDLKEHGDQAKFRRAEERFGRGKFLLNR